MNKLKKNKKKVALITGITGQDGSYLAELLLREGYEVHGVIRRASTFNTNRIEHLFKDPHESRAKLLLHFGDITDTGSIITLLEKVHPDEIYNLAAQSHVRVSFDIPEYTVNSVGLGALRVLEAIRILDLKTKYYQASSSEMFGSSPAPQNEQTAFNPRSPYGIAKLMGHHMTVNYRESYNIFAVSGILFNHESPRRGETFVTRKVTKAIANIMSGKQDKLYLGNLDSKRDWGFAKEYMQAAWMMLQQNKPDDFVIATGETHTVREFVELAFSLVGLNWKRYVKIDPRYFRPTEVDVLMGDAKKAKEILGWEPRVKFKELVRIMLNSDLKQSGVNKQIK
ncbi:GDP-mannose 4,6-dehydratase [Candidatus Daviesbacteria bacterium RIFCSPHIGHO2_02_FULL_41_14]|uniref:GDP-mannose 4,6-dehydratase n=1 Tax=Candidatus Daviesbacteria bacterium RIFCSPLOWO2_01_FULL_40_24 TaxID=1797787 RepID=A0A1F5MJ86_9BACT|nr:MAG: GDP-mannose 4,6-dehydratase [Candidatus Daviesbacteria bacterium RIFCSPHIGHO2_02_FULL_41_14]OGE65437.1 MAG: GDP-mannose 4,6-dehydratase [Candidatus Daviesbacteria bacterium RIFCSPLOWO2_01_FULL_40_24]